MKENPPSLLTWTTPSSVPIQITPWAFGDSATVVSVPQFEIPSFLEILISLPSLPMIDNSLRSMFLVKSSEAYQVSPRFTDLKRALPPTYTVVGLWGEMWIGVFQFHR